MATHKLSILVEALGTGDVNRKLKGVDRTLSNIGATANHGLRTAAGNLAKIGVVAAGAVAGAVGVGLHNLEQLESATTSVDGAIRQLGLTGKITASQVAGWSVQIETAVGSAFDDKDILRATGTLIRYGHVAPSALHQAMTVMTDLAAKTGSVDSASTLLAKALADPAKAAGKLSRAGVVLTKSQQDQIKAMVKAGKTAQAQKLLLDLLAKSTTGAAAASMGPLAHAQAELKDAWEEATKALAIGFLPILLRVADVLKTKLSDPGTLDEIKRFGQDLANAFGRFLSYAEKVPWDAIGNGLKTAGMFAGKLFDLFTNLPPQAQATLVALAGLNKLSGGAITGIVGEIGKGLIKGVLGMNAGVVNIKAGVVNGGGGGIPGAGAVESAAGAGIASTVAAAASALAAGAGLGLLMAAVGEWVLANSNDPTGSKGRTDTATARGLPAATVNPTRGFGQIDPMADWVKTHGGTLTGPLDVNVVKPVTVADPHTERQIDQLRTSFAQNASAARKSDATVDSTMHGVHQAILGTESRRAAQQATANARLGEIARKRWSTRINVMTRITDRISVSISSRSIAHQGYINKVTQSGSASKYLL